jgi:hypothetical protein
MTMCLALLLFLFLFTSSVEAQPLLNIRFDNDEFAGHFERVGNGVALDALPDRKRCLALDGAAGSLVLKPIQVKPLEKYKLTIRAAVDSKDTVESNDRIPEFSKKTYGKAFSGYELNFFDPEGQEVAFRLYKTVLIRTSGEIISRNIHDYVTVFYAPPKADTLRLKLRPQKNKLLIEGVKLESENAEGTVNCNPDFRYGELNPSGWVPHPEGRLYRRPDGRTVLKSGPSAHCAFFSVDDQSRYSFYCKGIGYDAKAGKATVSFYDENGNSIGSTHLFWDKDMKDGATKESIKPPPGSVRAMVHVALVIFEEVRVTKDK